MVLPPAAASAAGSGYVGSETCAGCHADEYARWQTSHHYAAMQPATADTVRGDFNNATFTQAGVRSRFFVREGRYFVETDNATGKLETFEVQYTFGLEPLQQYLVGFPDGRYQALSIAWDSRPAEAGGQRWFHLYTDVTEHKDPLHWTGAFQNWNSRCASCHSTNLHKNYSQANDSYATTWSEVNVACEACHGPGAEHLAWTRDGSKREHAGFAYSLSEAGEWRVPSGDTVARRVDGRRPMTQVNTCAHCHSRRVELSEPPISPAFLNEHQSRFLVEDLYYPDGQIREEVYVYDAFLQSRMHAAGVVCSNCHEPHSGRLRAEGNAVCTQCHQPATYAQPAHHRHKSDSTGAQCANCHMPETTYMVVDPRRDHSLRIPRPELSAQLGVPNACNQCHTDRSTDWAVQAAREWWGPAELDTLGPALAGAWRADVEAVPALVDIAGDASRNSIVRASALQALGVFPEERAFDAAQAGLRSGDPAMRIAALRALTFVPPERRSFLLPLAKDPVKAVRLELAPMLTRVPEVRAEGPAQASLTRLFEEYIAAQQLNADMPAAQMNLGVLYAGLGDAAAARYSYQHALKLAPDFVPALLNLADLYRALGQDASGEPLLERALVVAPDEASVQHAMGLYLVRAGKSGKAVNYLRRASEQQPESARYAFVYAVALENEGQLGKAIGVLEAALERHPRDRELLTAAEAYLREAGRVGEANTIRERLGGQ